MFLFGVLDDRLDDKDSLDFHDNPPAPDNVVREDDNTVRVLITNLITGLTSNMEQTHGNKLHR
jgi:hypothetical protein